MIGHIYIERETKIIFLTIREYRNLRLKVPRY